MLNDYMFWEFSIRFFQKYKLVNIRLMVDIVDIQCNYVILNMSINTTADLSLNLKLIVCTFLPTN